MRSSEFWSLMNGEFGAGYAATLAREHVLSALGERTPEQALGAGFEAREVWLALCVDLQVPVERRLGLDDPKGGGPVRAPRGLSGISRDTPGVFACVEQVYG